LTNILIFNLKSSRFWTTWPDQAGDRLIVRFRLNLNIRVFAFVQVEASSPQ